MNVKIENLASEIMKGLEEYSDMATDEVKKEVKKAGSNIRKDIQENAPVGETKKYAKSWSVKTMKETSNSIEPVSYTHLIDLIEIDTGRTNWNFKESKEEKEYAPALLFKRN